MELIIGKMGINTVEQLLEDIDKDCQRKADALLQQDIGEQCKIYGIIY